MELRFLKKLRLTFLGQECCMKDLHWTQQLLQLPTVRIHVYQIPHEVP